MISVDAGDIVKQQPNSWNHIHFHTTDALVLVELTKTEE